MNPELHEETKPQNWCGTELSFNLNEANQAPLNDNMVEIPEGERKYPCVTQHGDDATYSDPANTDGGGSAPDTPSGALVGVGKIIPRWSANKSNPTKLFYFIVRAGFASDNDFTYTSTCFKSAAEEWNALSLGLIISPVTDQTKANFLVEYYKPKTDKGTLASAFFPNDVEVVRVYDATLTQPYWRNILHNTFLHEIGHIIGLRHEFANDIDPKTGKPKEDTAQRIGGANPHSVMSYEDKNIINDQDKADTTDFYNRKNGSLVGGVPITDYLPVPLQGK